jgi:hypothetical protein
MKVICSNIDKCPKIGSLSCAWATAFEEGTYGSPDWIIGKTGNCFEYQAGRVPMPMLVAYEPPVIVDERLFEI